MIAKRQQSIEYVSNPLFSQPNAEIHVETHESQPGDNEFCPDGFDAIRLAPLERRRTLPVLQDELCQIFMAAGLIGKRSQRRVNLQDVNQIKEHLSEALHIRNRIVEANLRLVRFHRKNGFTERRFSLDELVNEGSVPAHSCCRVI